MSDQFPRFGATDFYTCETDATALAEQLRAALASYLGYTPTDSDPYMVVAFALLPYIVQNNALADAAAKTALLTYAIGGQLDRIADATCVVEYLTRKPAQPAYFAVYLDFSDCANFPVYQSGSPAQIQCTFAGSFTINGITYSARDPYGVSWIPTKTVLGTTFYQPWGIAYYYAQTDGAAGNISKLESTDAAIVSAVSNGVSNVTVDGVSITTTDGMTITPLGAAAGADIESDESLAARLAVLARAIRLPGGLEYYKNAVSDVYALGRYYIAPYAYIGSPSALAHGAVQAYFLEDRPVGCETECDPPEPGGVTPLSTRFAVALSNARLIGDKILYRRAVPAAVANPYELHYSLLAPSGDGSAYAAAEAAVQAEFIKILADYTDNVGILVNFDDMAARIVAAGAVDALVYRGLTTTQPVNLQLSPDEFLQPNYIVLVKDADTSQNTTPAGSGGSLIYGAS